MKLQVTERQYDTILAALRYWQDAIQMATAEEDAVRNLFDHAEAFNEFHAEIAAYRGDPLSSDEIDALCEDINTQDVYRDVPDIYRATVTVLDDEGSRLWDGPLLRFAADNNMHAGKLLAELETRTPSGHLKRVTILSWISDERTAATPSS